jgi:methyltransferase (TIGR00027 family)
MSDTGALRDVSDTARWVAIYRAEESERADALFDDPFARELAGERGAAIARGMPTRIAMGWPMVVRTAVIDELVLRCVRDGARTVLNLAAGLDARPYRLPLPADLRWIHVDMPAMVDYFRDAMRTRTPRCRVEFVGADLRDATTRREVLAAAADDAPVLAVSEGLLIYLSADDVAALADDLHRVAGARWWLSDLASPRLLKIMARRAASRLNDAGASLQFGPAEGTAFFAPHGWRETEFRSTWDEAVRLQRTVRGMWFWRLLMSLQSPAKREETRRMAGVALLEDASATTNESAGPTT